LTDLNVLAIYLMFVNNKHCIMLRYARTSHCISMKLFTQCAFTSAAHRTCKQTVRLSEP